MTEIIIKNRAEQKLGYFNVLPGTGYILSTCYMEILYERVDTEPNMTSSFKAIMMIR